MSLSDRVKAECEAQGLPERVTDPAVLSRVAALLAARIGGGANE